MIENYFELFGIQPAAEVDLTHLRKRFMELSRETHPDLIGPSADVLARSARLNTAYRTLQDPQSRWHHLFVLNGLAGALQKTALSPSFLSEMMELNEAAETAAPLVEKLALKAKAQALQAEKHQQVVRLLESWHTDGALASLEKAICPFLEGRYLSRVLEKLS